MKALNNISELQVSYTPVKDWHKQPRIGSSKEAYSIVKKYFPAETIHLQESFVILYLNQENRIIAVYSISKGGITGTVADVRLILGTALKLVAVGLIIAHNHPSGNINPSNSDNELTQKIKEASKLMDIKLLDHFIITPIEGKYFSFADEGL